MPQFSRLGEKWDTCFTKQTTWVLTATAMITFALEDVHIRDGVELEAEQQ